jgi:hypothetical protein
MATEHLSECVTMVAGEALTSDQYKIVKLDASGNVVKASAVTDRPFGILQNAPGNGGAAEVCIAGKSKLVCGGSVALGALLASNSAALGTAVTVAASGTTYNYATGIVLAQATAANGVATVLVFGGGQPLLV